MRLVVAAAVLTLASLACTAAETPPPGEPPPPAVDPEPALPDPDASIKARLEAEADALEHLVGSALAESFLGAVPRLPEGRAQTLYRTADGSDWLFPEQLIDLPPDERDALTPVEWSAARYYLTKYGTPLAYTRAMELLGEAGMEGFEGRRVLDFGYGGIGQLRLMALNGARVIGVDPDPLLRKLYAQPGDTGLIAREGGPAGRIELVEGRWPSTAPARDAVGSGFDLFLSKNVLKRGYVHPEREADPRHLLQLGVDDATFMQHLQRVVEPGGYVMIYNLCPPQAAADEPYIPWADGRCPFPKQLWIDHDFKVLAYDVDDSEAARAMGRALGWEDDPGALDESLFATYSLFQRF